MTDTTTEWTPERRKIREAERAAALAAMRNWYNGDPGPVKDVTLRKCVDQLYPPPPPEYTYGREVKRSDGFRPLVRRSDGEWGWWYNHRWHTSLMTDADARALAAEVPLSDAECEALTIGISLTAASRYAFIRAAFARVMRGEVAP